MDTRVRHAKASPRLSQWRAEALAEAQPAYDKAPHSFPANSVGVFPVTCRKAWENAGTLA